jgi:hypothetical protein
MTIAIIFLIGLGTPALLASLYPRYWFAGLLTLGSIGLSLCAGWLAGAPPTHFMLNAGFMGSMTLLVTWAAVDLRRVLRTLQLDTKRPTRGQA